MSLQFSDTTNKSGIIQRIERLCGFNDGDISGNTTRLAQFTADVNLALDKVFSIIFESAGTWQFDDSNHTDYPIITTNLVSGQRDYSFTADANSHLILDIERVFVANSNGLFFELAPVDVQSDSYTEGFTNGQNITGTPFQYDKTATGIFLDPIPSYNYTNGLKCYISREGSYFATSDTTKKPGFAGLFHEYLPLYVAYKYGVANDISSAGGVLRNGARTGYFLELYELEQAITEFYANRSRDERTTMFPEPIIAE